MTHVPEGDRVADEDTLLADEEQPGTSQVPFRQVQHCPECSSHFSSEARFCPYDGCPLVAAPDYDPLADPLLGRLIDERYAVIRVLGEGGMGTVYEVRHEKLERHFALKALRRDLAKDPELSARFIQEARATAALSHPGIVQITDFGTLDTGQAYFVMELLRGRPLTSVLHEEGPLKGARGLTIVRAIADALKAAHAARIIHRDLKPDNIQVMRLASGRETVKILDFGLARVGSGSRLTKDGFVFGTPHYMSPEQASGEAIDQRADMYSLGVLMYEIFTGTLPFEADTSMGVLTKHIYMDPVAPTAVTREPTLDGALERIILKCLEKRAEKRFEDMEELLCHLDGVAGSLESDPETGFRERADGGLPSRGSQPARILEIGWVSWVAGAAGLAAFALAGAILIGPSGKPPAQPSQSKTVRALSPAERPGAQPQAGRPDARSAQTPALAVSERAPAPTSFAKRVPALRENRVLPERRERPGSATKPAQSQGSSVASDPSHEAPREPPPRVGNSLPPRAAPPKEVIDPWAP